LSDPEIRDEAIQILRGLLERVVITSAETSFEVEIVGEIAHMIEMGMDEGKKKGPVLNERMARSVKMVAGACNRLDLQLQKLLAIVVPT